MPWSIISVGICFVVFGALARLCPCNPGQPRFLSRELPDDVLYYFVSVLFYTSITAVLTHWLVGAAFGPGAKGVIARIEAGYGLLSHLPLLVQALLVVVVSDVIQYWLHRGFHTRRLWDFHAIHHSAEHPTWSTTFRIHPVNYLLYTVTVAVLVGLMGFSPAVFVILAPFNFVMSVLVHANLNWTFGPFRYVIASPVFHRWHHASDPAARDKNFAPTFPVLDLMFGTFHMPKGQLPESFGAEGVPPHFIGQMLHPIRPLLDRLERPRKPGLSSDGA